MIKLLIADDEAVIREGMLTIIDWESLGVKVVAVAGNGRDGLAKAMAEKPDIVITDIRMPVVDGIKFSKSLREKLPKVRIVFLTGYNDFEYTRHAVKVRAEDYLLKPVNTRELMELVGRLVKEIRLENSTVEENVRKTVLLKENLPVMRNRFIQSFFTGKLTEGEFLERGRSFGIPFGQTWGRAVIFCIDYYFQLAAGGEREADLLKYALSNVAEEVLGRLGEVCVCDEGGARLLFLLGSERGTKEVAESAEEVQFYMRKYYGLPVSAGIGKLVLAPRDFKRSYENANEALEVRIKEGSGRILAKEDQKEGKKAEQAAMLPERMLISGEEEAELKDAVVLLDRRKVYALLENIFRKYVMEREIGRKGAEWLCLYLALIAVREAQALRLLPEEVLGKDYYYYKEVSKYETAKDLELWMKDIYGRVIRFGEDRRGKYKGIVTGGIAYAKEHFSESIQVTDVAGAVYVTPNYFSKVFKEETGENFTDWLNKYRIEMAKKRMKQEPEEKIYSIAGECGFADYKYFAFIFKKYTGYTPTAYRNLIG